jgi:hypothetical protein
MQSVSLIKCEWHAVHLDDETMFLGAGDLQPRDIADLASNSAISMLPPINSPAPVGIKVAGLLSSFGVLAPDTCYTAVEKVVVGSGLHQVGLGET